MVNDKNIICQNNIIGENNIINENKINDNKINDNKIINNNKIIYNYIYNRNKNYRVSKSNNLMKIVYFYETPTDLQEITDNPKVVDLLYVGPFMFSRRSDTVMKNEKNKKNKTALIDYEDKNILHFNNEPDEILDKVWAQTKQIGNLGVDVHVLLGGDKTFETLFDDYGHCYPLLKSLLKSKYWITGINLEVIEYIDVDLIKMFIRHVLKKIWVLCSEFH